MSRRRTTARSILVLLLAGALPGTAQAGVPRLVFPVVAKTHYTNDFGDPRWQGAHQGNDIMARRRSEVVAVEAGRVEKYRGSSSGGCMLYLYGRSGTTYLYVHLNNDRTMRNDTRGNSTCRNRIAYAPGLRNREWVRAGQLVAYVGDSGDANGISPHLHFEVHKNRGAVSPYRHLRRAREALYARPPASRERPRLKIRGRVLSTRLDVEPQRLRVRVTATRLSNGWYVRPARKTTLRVPSGSTIERSTGTGSHETTLAEAKRGDRVIVWTTRFRERLSYAVPRGARHTAARVLLR